MKHLWILLALVIFTPAYAADESVQKVIGCMRANVPPTLQVQTIELLSTDRAGSTRTLKGKIYVMREKSSTRGSLLRVMMHIDSPGDVAGSSYLVREADDYLQDGMYVYLPSVRRVKRITGSFAYGSLLGTDFTYDDFKRLENSFGSLNATMEKTEEIDGRPVDVLLFKGEPEPDAPARSARAWVDQKTCVPLKIDFIEGQNVRKRLTALPGALQQSGKFWYLSEVQMVDLKYETKTILRAGELNAGKELPKRLFDPTLFYSN